MAAPAFGFSVGDFVTALNLIVKVTQSLHDVKGASAEYNLILIQLHGLEQTLLLLQRLVPNEYNASSIETIKCMAFGCMVPLRSFLDDIKKYESTLSTGVKRRHGRGDLRKVQWGLCMEKKVALMRSTITAQILGINMLLGAHQLDAISQIDVRGHETQMQVAKCLQEQRSTATLLVERQTTESEMLSNLPKILAEQAKNLNPAYLQQARDSQVRFGVLQKQLCTRSSSLPSLSRLEHGRIAVSDQSPREEESQRLILPDAQNYRESLTRIEKLLVSNTESLSGMPCMSAGVAALTDKVAKIDRDAIQTASNQAQCLLQMRDDIFDVQRMLAESLQPRPNFKPSSSIEESRSQQINISPTAVDLFLRGLRLMVLKEFAVILLLSLMELYQRFPQLKYLLLVSKQCLLMGPRMLLDDNIRFYDATGRFHSLQFSLVCHWEVFEALLKATFKGHPSENLIEKGHYLLRCKSHTITKESWEAMVRPRQQITMSVVIRDWFLNQPEQLGVCPRPQCGVPINKDLGMYTTCHSCGLEFGGQMRATNTAERHAQDTLRPFKVSAQGDMEPVIQINSSITRGRGKKIGGGKSKPLPSYPRPSPPLASRKRTDSRSARKRFDSRLGLYQRSRNNESCRRPDVKADILQRRHSQTADDDNLLLLDSLKRVHLEYVTGIPSHWVPRNISTDHYDRIHTRDLDITYRNISSGEHRWITPFNLGPIRGRPCARADKPMPSQWPGMVYFEVKLLHEPRHDPGMMVGYEPIKQGRNQIQGCYLTSEPSPGRFEDTSDDDEEQNFDLHCSLWGHIIGCGVDFYAHKAFYTWNGILIGYDPTSNKPPLNPIVLFNSHHNSVRVNFGQKPFEFDISSFAQNDRKWGDMPRRAVSLETTNFADFMLSQE